MADLIARHINPLMDKEPTFAGTKVIFLRKRRHFLLPDRGKARAYLNTRPWCIISKSKARLINHGWHIALKSEPLMVH